MSSIDERIVNMKFNNSSFVSGVAKTISSLGQLKKSLDLTKTATTLVGSLSSVDRAKKSLNFAESTKSLNGLETSASRFQMGGMVNAVEGVSKKFLVLGTIGVAALAHITTKALDAGTALAKSITIDPIMAGLENYETKINSIQTILANTRSAGTKLSDVTAVLNELNEYANKTIYNFSEMTKNIGTFTAAGVDLKTATNSIKGIANLAALSGSNSQQASTAMYQLSQAISAGQVHLQDWNSVVNAGMGGTVFQRALAQTAVAMGTLDKSQLKLKGTMKNVTIDGNAFRQSLTPPPGGTSWLTSKVLTTALSTFTGDLSKGQLAAQGFTKAQIKAIQAQAKTAVKAATQIKTISQMNQALKEEVASSWSNVWETLIGDFHSAPKLLTPLHNTLQNLFQAPAIHLNKLLKAWSKFGGRDVAILGIKHMFEDIGRVIQPIKDAFHLIFPPKTGRDLYNMTVAFANFMDRLKIGDDTVKNLSDTFTGVFAALHILKTIASGVLHFFGSLFSSFHQGTGSISAFTAGIGSWLYYLDKSLSKGGKIQAFFQRMSDAIKPPLVFVGKLASAIGHVFDGLSAHSSNTADGAFGKIHTAIQKLKDAFSSLGDHLKHVLDPVKKVFDALGEGILNAIRHGNFDTVLKLINTIFFGGIFLAFKKFTKNISNSVGQITGLVGSVKGVFGEITNTLKTMQQEVKSQIILNIAKAVGILMLSVVALSLVDHKKMTIALKGLATGFAELIGAVAILGHLEGKLGAAKVPALATGLILLAGAIVILSTAVIALSLIPADNLERGLVAVGSMIAFLVGATTVLKKGSVFLPVIGAGMIAVATAIDTLTVAVLAMSVISWQSLGKGLAGLAGIFAVLAAGVKLLPAFKLISIGIGMNEIAVALGLMAVSMGLMTAAIFAISRMSWESLAKGLLTIAAAITAISLGVKLMPKDVLLKAAALDAISGALLVISISLSKLGKMSVGDVAKSVGAIGGALAILAVGLKAMKGSIRGSIALGIASAALYGLALALAIIGNLSLETLGVGLAGLAGAFLVIGVAGRVLQGAIPGLIGFGVALAAIGVGGALIGFAVKEFADALSTLAKSGTSGLKVLFKAVEKFITLLPDLATALAKSVVAFIKVFSKNGPAIVKGLASLLEDLMQAIIKELPTFLKLFTKLIHTIIDAIDQNAGDIINAALRLLETLLKAVAKKLPDIIKAGADIVVNFIKGLGDNIGRVIDAGFEFIVKFLNGVADAIDKHEEDILKAGAHIGLAIVQGFWKGMGDLLGWVWGKIKGFFTGLWNKILNFFGVHSPATKGIELGKAIIQGLWNGISGLAGWVWDKVSNFFHNLWGKITGIFSKVSDLGKHIVQGIWNGISGIAGWIVGKVSNFAHTIWSAISNGFKNALDLGKKLVEGIWNGISQGGVWLALHLIGWINNTWSAFTGLISNAWELGRSIVNKIWDGILSLKNWIEDKLTGFLDDLWGGITDFLGIGTPSNLMAHAGEMMMRGMGKGIDDNRDVVNKALEKVHKNIKSHVDRQFNGIVDTTPRIAPVLDLSNVQRDAAKLPGYLAGASVDSTVSFKAAADISGREHARVMNLDLLEKRKDEPRQIKFEQTNVSPKALSASEIYRNTNNQLRFATEVLDS